MEHAVAIDVVLFAKPGCHLCEDVAEQLEALAERLPLQLTIVDITADFELHRRMWDRIPVVKIGERELSAPIEPRELAAAIEALTGRPERSA